MSNNPSIHNHAVQRLKERFDTEEPWLLEMLEQGKFVWLKGAGHSADAKNVRSGHLVYIPDQDVYCVVVMDDRSRLAVTVLTEEMAIKSSWGRGLDETSKLKAKRLALGKEVVPDINFFLLYAEERDGLSVKVEARAMSYDWKLTIKPICRINIESEQLSLDKMNCELTEVQMNEVSNIIQDKIASKEIRPFVELIIKTGKKKFIPVSNQLEMVSGLEKAEIYRRWLPELN